MNHSVMRVLFGIFSCYHAITVRRKSQLATSNQRLNEGVNEA